MKSRKLLIASAAIGITLAVIATVSIPGVEQPSKKDLPPTLGKKGRPFSNEVENPPVGPPPPSPSVPPMAILPPQVTQNGKASTAPARDAEREIPTGEPGLRRFVDAQDNAVRITREDEYGNTLLETTYLEGQEMTVERVYSNRAIVRERRLLNGTVIDEKTFR